MNLTLPQQDIYFEQLLYSDQPIYNIGAKIKIEGELDIELFNKAYILLINQHDAYRTVFYKNKETVYGKIIENFEDQLEYLDFSNSNATEESALAIIEDKYLKPFNITSGSFLHRFSLIKVSKDFYYFFTVCHHIIVDGWGTSVMFQRLVKNYNELLEYGEVKTEYPYSYKNFVADDEEYQKSEDYINHRDYWVEKFKTLPENLFTKKDPYSQLARSERKTLTISRSIYNALNRQSKELNCSTFHLLFSLLYVYFGRKHQNDDFVIGLPVLNRSTADFKRTVGLFMGVSPLRIKLDYENTLQELIVAIKNELRQDYRYRRFPIGKLVQELQLFQETEKLLNITLSYEKQDYSNNFGSTKTSVIPLSHKSERVALAIYIREFDDNEDVNIDFDYNLNYFDGASIAQVTSHYENLIQCVLNAPDSKLKDLNYLSAKEEEQLLVTFNNTKADYPNKTLLDFFGNQVKENANKIALSDKNETLSYVELDNLSNKIAEYISNYSREKNIDNIGVLLERSATTIAILLGILKAGKSYIPLDPTFPEIRLQYIIDHSGIELLISDQAESKFSEITTIESNDLLISILKLNGNVRHEVKSSDTAYVIYTSGSTGKPKGVEIGHKALLNFLLSMKDKPGVDAADILFAVTTYSFDISILEFFAPLISGASIFIVDNETLKEPEKLIQLLNEVNPTIIQATPSFYQMLFNAGWGGSSSLKVLCGGDLLSEDLADQLLQKCGDLWNMYGPTETTIWSSIKRITAKEEASNIGMPINNTEFYILDSFKKLVPIGSSGALYIGGDGLAKGYFKAPELSQHKFIPNPYNRKSLIYETNDMARWTLDGEVEFLGRNDNQVKIRGYRIELGEIETRLNNLPEVKQAIVIAKKNNNQNAFLVAYILKENDNYNQKSCILTLENELPKYMVPYTYVEVEDFPLTPNKKVDRKILSQREITKSQNRKEFQEPQSELQEGLIEFWKEVLQIESAISIEDNFFSLGGHSLNAVKLIHLINSELLYSINLKTIFDFPTVISLSKYLSTIDHSEKLVIPESEKKEYYQITPSQWDIWLASQDPERSISYNMVAAFRVNGEIDIVQLNKAVNQLILEHEILRTNFVESDGGVYQKVNDAQACKFEISIDDTTEDRVNETIRHYINSEFNLEEDLLVKMKIIDTGKTTSYLIFCTHHIIMDGWSLEIFTKDFFKNYSTQSNQNKAADKVLQFKDYAEWLTSNLESASDNNFWSGYLKDFHFKESFLSNITLIKIGHEGDHRRFEFTKLETDSIGEYLKRENVTLHSFLIAVLNCLIFKFSEHDDVVIGTVNSGRNNHELTDMIGMFVKTLPLRTKMSEEQTFKQVLESVHEGVLVIGDNQDIPDEHRIKPLYDILVAFQNPDFSYQDLIKIEKLELQSYQLDVEYSRIPLLFNFFITDNLLNLVVSYNTNKYDLEMIELIILKYKKMIHSITSNRSQNLSDLDIALDFEKQKSVKIEFDF